MKAIGWNRVVWRRHGLTLCFGAWTCGVVASANDLAALSAEFDDPDSFDDWEDLGIVEGWGVASYESADVDTSASGRLRVVPGPLTWFNHLRGLLLFKEITGDFIATTEVEVLSRHNPEDPTEPPNRSFSLAGLFIHGPRDIHQAAPVPYTTSPVWPPTDFGSDYVPNTENYIFLSYGSAGNPGTRQFEIKATRNSDSRLYYSDTGVAQNQTRAWLQIVRVGDTFLCLRKHEEDGEWIIENRYPNPDHPLPDFGETLQVGMTAYTDWPTASPFSGSVESAFHFNYAPQMSGNPDLIAEFEYFRFRRPPVELTESLLMNAPTSYDPNSNATVNPPVQLASAPEIALFLGANADTVYDPYGDWSVDHFGLGSDPEESAAGQDPDGDLATNLWEFISGSDPLDMDSAPETSVSLGGTHWVYTFRVAVETGVHLEAQMGTELGEWAPIATRGISSCEWETQLPDGATLEVDDASGMVRLEFPVGGPAMFLRVLASM